MVVKERWTIDDLFDAHDALDWKAEQEEQVLSDARGSK